MTTISETDLTFIYTPTSEATTAKIDSNCYYLNDAEESLRTIKGGSI